MINLQKLSGVLAISEAIIYIVAFVFFGSFWAFPSDGTSIEKMTYLAENQFSFSLIYFLMYIVFGVFLAVLVIGLYEKLKHINNALISIGSLFGVLWVGLVIASGMISNIGLSYAIELIDVNTEKAIDIWVIISLITESLGGGNELVGGFWVLLICLGAIQADVFSKYFNYLGIFVGIAGIATVYPEEIFTEIFGVTQIVWFIWLGISLLSHQDANKRMQLIN